jgi:dTDP-glucose 4,6-dehydratase
MKALITGGAGFIGHHVVEHLLDNTDWHLTLIDRLDISGNLNRLAEVGAAKNPRVKFVYHDLKAPISDQLLRQIQSFDYIVHLAAATHVDRSIEDPLSFVYDNVVATCNILDYARRATCGRFLYFSTDEVFGSAPAGVAYKEWDRYKSTNPYSASKAGGEELAVAYHNTYGVPALITHTMNVFGERQHPEKYIPSTIRKIRDDELVTIHSNAERTKAGSRFYIHAKAVADAVTFVLENGTPGDKYNIVGEREVDNEQLALSIAFIMGKGLNRELTGDGNRPGHDLRYALDGGKLAAMGWRPPSSFQSSLFNTVTWTLENPHWL